MIYAQIDDTGLCFAVSSLSGEVSAPNLIPLASMAATVLGQRWTGTEWVEVAPPEPEPVRTLTKLQFRNRFTFAEKQAIYAAAAVSVDIRIFLDDISVAEEINLDDPATVFGVQTLEAGGLLAAGRAAEILG